MKKINFHILTITSLCILISCDSLIEPEVDNRRDINTMLSDPARFEGVLLSVYADLPITYNFDIDAATDDAVTNRTNSNYRRMASDGWLSTSSPVSKWSYYDQIYMVNLFLKNVDNMIWGLEPKLTEAENVEFKTLHTKRLKGEAYALRAWLQFQLLQAHSGISESGELLGFPIVTEPLTIGDNLKIPRATFDQSVDQIIRDCDEAIKNLPFIYRDSVYVPANPNSVYNTTMGARYHSRMNGAIAKTIKVKTMLYAASPAYNLNSDISRWQETAQLSGELLKELGDGTLKLSPSGQIFYTRAYNHADVAVECIWRGNRRTNISGYETANFPPSMQGNGNINPTQNLINAFPDANGYPIDKQPATGGLYDESKPYENRDPRLQQYIVYNKNPQRNISTYKDAPVDGINASIYATRTGYYLRKFVNEAVTITGSQVTGVDRFHALFRHTDLMLMYAEAANEAYGPDGKPQGISFSSRDIINMIRNRAGITNTDYVNSINLKEEFRMLIQNERRIELCFEGERFWDIRRWKLLDEMKKPASGILIETVDNGLTFSYSLLPTVEQRKYEDYMIYAPIPKNETLKYDLQQNRGWR